MRHEKACLREILASHICNNCDNTSNSKAELIEHMRKHIRVVFEPPYPCTVDFCDEIFRLKTRLRKHEEVDHGLREGEERVARPAWTYNWNEINAGQEAPTFR